MNTPSLQKVLQYINKGIKLLEEEYKLLTKTHWLSYQKVIDVRTGVFRRNSGILIPKEIGKCRVLYESYHINLLEVFISFVKQVLKYRKLPIASFSLRSILEMSFTRINVHFSKNVSSADEKRIRLLSILADYALIDLSCFQKLFQSEKKILNAEQVKIINHYLIKIGSSERFKEIKKMRKQINSLYSNAIKQVPSYSFITKLKLNNEEIISSHLSHFLHGDPYSVKGLIETNAKEQEKRVLAILIRATVNAVNRVGEFLNDSGIMSKVNEFNNKLEDIWKELLDIKF